MNQLPIEAFGGQEEITWPPSVLRIEVLGKPAPQGSKRAVMHKTLGRPVLIESSKALPVWREAVVFAARTARENAGWETALGPVSVDIMFLFDRPQSHYGTGRNAGMLKLSAPAFPVTAADVDKLSRAILDGLTTARVFKDDKQVVELRAVKVYVARPLEEQAVISVTPL